MLNDGKKVVADAALFLLRRLPEVLEQVGQEGPLSSKRKRYPPP